MSRNLCYQLLDEQNNYIIIDVDNVNRTIKIYQKRPLDLFFRAISTPQLPFKLFDYLQKKYVYLYSNEKSVFLIQFDHQQELFNIKDLFNHSRISPKHIAAQDLEKLKEIPPPINTEHFLTIEESEKLLEPSLDTIIDAKALKIATQLPEEIKTILIRQLKYELHILNEQSSEDIISALYGVLNWNENDILQRISSSILSEYWLSYRFIQNSDVEIADCQHFVLEIISEITKYHSQTPIDGHNKQISNQTIKAFLLKNYISTDNEEARHQTYHEQAKKIESFLDYPEGTDKEQLKNILYDLIFKPEEVQALAPDKEINDFLNHLFPIMEYWEPIVYTSFVSYLWKLCDMVLRFVVYLDILTLRFSETAKLLTEFEQFNENYQSNIMSMIHINNNDNFKDHLCKKVLGY